MDQSLKKHIRNTFSLAYPVAIGGVGYIGMQVVDNIMIGGLGAVQLAAATVANSIFIIHYLHADIAYPADCNRVCKRKCIADMFF